MAKTIDTLIALRSGFDYNVLKPAAAEKLRRTAKSIKERIRLSIRSLIEAGQGLLEVKTLLPHGQFGLWLKAEFGWSDRTAQRLMDVAQQFGTKSDILSDLGIPVTALYLLAAPSTPFQARQTAIDKAQAGEDITPAVASEIIRAARKKTPLQRKPLAAERFSQKLRVTLNHFRDRCDPDNIMEYARQLHQFASALEGKSRSAIGLVKTFNDKRSPVKTSGRRDHELFRQKVIIKV
jgi:hypothetical protein